MQENKNNLENPNASREEWNAGEIAEQSVNEEPDETLRKVLRGDESKGDPDERDVVGDTETKDTQQGREERKNQVKNQESENG